MNHPPALTRPQRREEPPAEPVRSGDLLVHPDFAEALRHARLCSLDDIFRIHNDQSLSKPGLRKWRERVRIDIPLETRTTTVFVKRFHRPPLREQLGRILAGRARYATAWLEWRWCRYLRHAGIPAATAIAFGQQMGGIWEKRSALMTAAVPGESLEQWASRRAAQGRGSATPSRKSVLIRSAADLIRDFHALGLIHRDLYLSHIFVEEGDDGACRMRLIDLHRVFRPRVCKRRWIVKDLASLNYSAPSPTVTPRDRLRWLKRYLGVSKLREQDRSLIRAVMVKTARIAGHDAARRRRHERPES